MWDLAVEQNVSWRAEADSRCEGEEGRREEGKPVQRLQHHDNSALCPAEPPRTPQPLQREVAECFVALALWLRG